MSSYPDFAPSRTFAIPSSHASEASAASWMAAAFVVIWALWAVAFNTAQFGDNLEQFNWSHSLEWGYYKHPPMPTWLLGAAIHLFGPSRWWAIVMAALCALATAGLTHAIVRRMLGPRAAAAALLLWSLQLCFSSRVQLYNHNTVLVVFVAAAIWSALRTRQGGLGWWLLTGLFAGAAMLSKYQAVLPLTGLLCALAWTGRLREKPQQLGLALALGTMLAVFAPHAAWVVDHDFTTLRYASQSIEPESLAERGMVLLSFAFNQVRMVFAALAAIVICGLLARRARAVAGAGKDTVANVEADSSAHARALPPEEVRIWLICLVWGPLVALALLALAGGVVLRNHWGVQTLQFVSLWMVWRWRHLLVDMRRLIGVAIVVQAMGLALYAEQQTDPDAMLSTRRMDTVYPAQRMADAALQSWRGATHCPLRYVAGPSFQAGLISLYAGGTAQVSEGAFESPWITKQDMVRDGALYVVEGDAKLPRGVAAAQTFSLSPLERAGTPARTITIGVRPPAAPCH